jgi:tetraacyldisaccharide 4'-kinase
VFSILGKIYGGVMNTRNRLYDKGVFDSFDLGARTISVGNITTGGTGKTPLVAYIAKYLIEKGETVCILTRGYGRRDPKKRVLVSAGRNILAVPGDAGDEPVELAKKLNGKAVIIADADRVSAGEWAKREFGVTRFVLDDGFQHRRVKRDLDIVCIDATNPFGGGEVLPAGRLREPLGNLARADAIVITRSDLVENISNLRSEISNLAPDAKIFAAQNRSQIFDIKTGSKVSVGEEAVLAFCGLGNPEGFFKQIALDGIDVLSKRSFRDHYQYEQSDIDDLEQEARRVGADRFLTTAKDAVKLSDLNFEIPILVMEINVEIDDAAAFTAML